VVRFYEPIVVNHAAKSAHIDQAVQCLPAFAPEAANPAFRRGERQRDQQDETGEPDGDEWALFHVFPHPRKIESLVRADICKKMQANIEERKQTEHTPEADEIRNIQKLAQRCDRQGDEQEPQRPISGKVLDKFNRIGRELPVICAPTKIGEWRKAN